MNDFKLNAAKMIAAQKSKNRAQSPESLSNWDSSDPEEAMPHISSEEEVSVKSNRSQRNKKLNGRDTKIEKPSLKTGLEDKKLSAKMAAPSAASKSHKLKMGVTSFVDHGLYDSDEDDASTASKKKKKKSKMKDENPPYDFREALDDDDIQRSAASEIRPGRSRKGQVYDLPHGESTPKKKERKSSWDEDPSIKALQEELERSIVGEAPTDLLPVNKNNNQNEGQRSSKSKGWPLMMGKIKAPKPQSNNMNISQQHLIGTLELDGGANMEVGVLSDEQAQIELEKQRCGVPVFTDGDDARFIYYFHHGSKHYLDNRHHQQDVYMEGIADKSERLVRRGILEVCATLRIITSAILIILLESFRCITFHIIGAFIGGAISTVGDFLLKPVLSALFNSICQPGAMFLYNVAVALRTISVPIRDTFTALLSPIAMLLRALRLVEINWHKNNGLTDQVQHV